MTKSIKNTLSGMLGGCLIYGLMILQGAAIIAGFQYWLDWPAWICTVLSVLIVMIFRVGIVGAVLGVIGAHYGWHFSWIASILIFCGPALLLFALTGVGMTFERLRQRG